MTPSDKTATRDRLADMAAAASVPRLLDLLAQARMALPPEYFDLAGRIDDVLNGTPPLLDGHDACNDLILESYGAGHAWLRP